ncbi:MAG: energy transducer TonB [Pseudomonadota bacterium]
MTSRAIHLLEDESGHEFRRWSLAALIVLAAHLGLMGTYFLLYKPQPAGAPEGPAILIDLSPPAAPASPKDTELGPVQEEAVPPPEPQVMEMKPPEPVVEPPPPVPMESPVVLQPEPPKPQEIEKPKEKPPETKKVERKKPVQRTTAGPRSERDSDHTSAPSAGASGAAVADWRSMVVSKLQSAKRYPSGAESRREQGVVTLSFTLSRSGAVLSRSIARSSGYPDLDQEVLSMVQRAAPFPPFPAGMNQASQHLTAPVRFSLR